MTSTVRQNLGDDDLEAPWFFRKSSFDKVKGYNPELYAGEDWDLFERMKSINCKWDRIDSKIHHQRYSKRRYG